MEGINLSDGFFAGREEELSVQLWGRESKSDSKWKMFKEREKHTCNKSSNLLIFLLDLKGRTQMMFDALC